MSSLMFQRGKKVMITIFRELSCFVTMLLTPKDAKCKVSEFKCKLQIPPPQQVARLHEKHRQKKITHTPFIIDMTMRFWRTASDVPFFSSVISALYSVYSSVPPLERIRSCYTAHWAFRPSVMVSANLDKVSIVLLWWTFRVAQLMCDVEGQLCALNVLIPQCLWLQLGSQALEKSCLWLPHMYFFGHHVGLFFLSFFILLLPCVPVFLCLALTAPCEVCILTVILRNSLSHHWNLP